MDVEGDGVLELAALAEGSVQILSETNGRFEDVSDRYGLAGLTEVGLLRWADYDSDGKVDLFVGAQRGASRLFRNEGSIFTDMTAASGLAIVGPVVSADWIDRDGDGRIDLFVLVEREGQLAVTLQRGLEGGFFETIPFAGLEGALGTSMHASPEPELPVAPDPEVAVRTEADHGEPASSRATVAAPGVRTQLVAPLVSLAPSAPPLIPFLSGCARTVDDDSLPGSSCISAASIPTLGKLYPLSTEFFVSPQGRVAIGSTSPLAKLDILGGADAFGAADPVAIALQYRSGGFRHFLRSRHDSAAGSGGNAIDFFLNDSADPGASSAPGAGNVQVMTVNATVANRLVVSGGVELDSGGSSNGSYTGAMLRFGSGGSGEGVLSKRTVGGNQFGLELMTGGTSRLAVTNGGNVGIGTTAPETTLHVLKGSAGAVTADANSGLVVENGTHAYISILTPDASERGILFGEPSNNATGAIAYNTSAALDGFVFRTNGGNNRMVIRDNGFVGIGTTTPTERLDVGGSVRSQCVKITGGCDVAEPFEVSGKDIEPGMVVRIDPENPGQLMLSAGAYDTTVAGVISGAGGVNTGVSLAQDGVFEGGELVALAGRVYCWCDAAGGAIRPGDLLTTSDVPGHGMKASDRARAGGAVLGKALSGLAEGRGLVLIVVSLQ